jgi:hypothetical protein
MQKSNVIQSTPEIVSIPKLPIKTVEIEVTGISPLVVNKWSNKSIIQIKEKQEHLQISPRKARNPKQECEDAIYYIDKAKTRYGFKIMGFKRSMVEASTCVPEKKISKALVMRNITIADYLLPDTPTMDLVEIKSSTPKMLTSNVTLGSGVGDLRYRPIFKKWSATLPFEYNETIISKQQILQLLALAGHHVGVGEWRNDKGGIYGRFMVTNHLEGNKND